MTLFWYDFQGCIEADKINIIEELPLLTVMIRIFEDFPLGMWGYTPINVWTEDENRKKVPKGAMMGSFQIKGRPTFTADAPKIPAQTVTAPTTMTASTTALSSHLNEPAQPSSSHDEHSEGTQLEDERLEDILFFIFKIGLARNKTPQGTCSRQYSVQTSRSAARDRSMEHDGPPSSHHQL